MYIWSYRIWVKLAISQCKLSKDQERLWNSFSTTLNRVIKCTNNRIPHAKRMLCIEKSCSVSYCSYQLSLMLWMMMIITWEKMSYCSVWFICFVVIFAKTHKGSIYIYYMCTIYAKEEVKNDMRACTGVQIALYDACA